MMKTLSLTAALLACTLATPVPSVQAAPPEGGVSTFAAQAGPPGMGDAVPYVGDVVFGHGPGMPFAGMPAMCGPMAFGPLPAAPMFGTFTAAGPLMAGGMGRTSLAAIMALPDLSEKQRQSITNRQRELQRRLVRMQEKALEAQFALQDASSGDRPDPNAVGSAMQSVFDVRRQMVEAVITAHNDFLDILTEEQVRMLSSHGGHISVHGAMMQ